MNKVSNFTFALAKTSLHKPKRICCFSASITFLKVCNPLWHLHIPCVKCHLFCVDKKRERQLLYEVPLSAASFLCKALKFRFSVLIGMPIVTTTVILSETKWSRRIFAPKRCLVLVISAKIPPCASLSRNDTLGSMVYNRNRSFRTKLQKPQAICGFCNKKRGEEKMKKSNIES